jgi:hypothetical protein
VGKEPLTLLRTAEATPMTSSARAATLTSTLAAVKKQQNKIRRHGEITNIS